jgi:tRNA A58 N-methylase Trm61
MKLSKVERLLACIEYCDDMLKDEPCLGTYYETITQLRENCLKMLKELVEDTTVETMESKETKIECMCAKGELNNE